MIAKRWLELRDGAVDGALCMPAVQVPGDLAIPMAVARLRAAAELRETVELFTELQYNSTGTGYRVAQQPGKGAVSGLFVTVSHDSTFVWRDEVFECARCGGTDEDGGMQACGDCDNCTECCTCDMWYCESCDEYVSDDVASCGNCDNCENCCSCEHCSACSEDKYQDDMCSYGCGNCEGCCECLRCANCGDVVDSTCEDGYGEECCCDSDCSHAQNDDEDED